MPCGVVLHCGTFRSGRFSKLSHWLISDWSIRSSIILKTFISMGFDYFHLYNLCCSTCSLSSSFQTRWLWFSCKQSVSEKYHLKKNLHIDRRVRWERGPGSRPFRSVIKNAFPVAARFRFSFPAELESMAWQVYFAHKSSLSKIVLQRHSSPVAFEFTIKLNEPFI